MAVLGLQGCVQRPMDVTELKPRGISVEAQSSFFRDFDMFPVYHGKDFSISASIFEYNLVLGVLLEIKNNSSKNLSAKDYAVTLADGRDHKIIKMLSRDDLVAIRSKVAGTSDRALQDQLIETAFNNAMKVANVPTKDQMVALLNEGIQSYFAFRPIYAHETRRGLLAFVPHFTLEYPLTLTVKIKGETLAFEFNGNER
jgi:hypothetical protein